MDLMEPGYTHTHTYTRTRDSMTTHKHNTHTTRRRDNTNTDELTASERETNIPNSLLGKAPDPLASSYAVISR